MNKSLQRRSRRQKNPLLLFALIMIAKQLKINEKKTDILCILEPYLHFLNPSFSSVCWHIVLFLSALLPQTVVSTIAWKCWLERVLHRHCCKHVRVSSSYKQIVEHFSIEHGMWHDVDITADIAEYLQCACLFDCVVCVCSTNVVTLLKMFFLICLCLVYLHVIC